MRLRSAIVALLVSSLLLGASTASLAQNDPQLVIDALETARSAGDIDTALAQFDDTAVVIVQGQTSRSYVGRDGVRMFLQTVAMRFQLVMRSIPLVEGSGVTWTERDVYGGQALDATVSAIVVMGHITSLTFRDNEPSAPTSVVAAATTPRPTELPSYAWPAGLALLGLGLLVLAFGRPRRRASQSQLDGRLLIALRRQHELQALNQLEDREQRAA